MPKLKLSSRILLYFLLLSLVPLVVTNYLLVTSANKQLLNAASTKQQAVADYLSNNVGNYLGGNVQSLSYLAHIYLDHLNNNTESASVDRNMSILFHLYPDLQRLAILNSAGKEQKAFDTDGKITELKDASGDDTFKAIKFLAGKDYISSVSYNQNNDPLITIAVPLLASDHPNPDAETDVQTESSIVGADDSIAGAVIATYNIKDLWSTVLSTKIGDGGYAYVIDGLGNLVAHPDSEFLASNQKLVNVQTVKQFIDGNFDTRRTVSETGESVISTPRVIQDSGWGVIVEEPVASINAGVNSYIKLAATVGIVAIILSILASIFFRRQLVIPISKLADGAKRLGSGQFDHTIDVRTNDELQDLAETFNSMGLNIKNLVRQMKANNQNLSNEKTKLDNIINSVTDGIIAVDNFGKIVSINPPAASLISSRPENLIGKPLAAVFPWRHDDKPLEITFAQAGNRQYSDVTLQQGEQIAYLDLVVSATNRHDSDMAAIVTIRDMTKSRELEFMKLDFVAIAAHELRTPLTVVRGYLDMLNEAAIKSFSIFNIENLQKAIHSVNELRDLINKLLNIARIERGEMDIFIEKVDLQKLTKENVHHHQTAAAQKQQTLTYESATDGPVYVPADPSSITEVLNNLIGNAIKFTESGKEIKVRLMSGDDEVRIEVSDNGPGIPTHLRDKLFTKFYRAERSLIAGTRGTGLGLFISRTIIELQKGKIGLLPSTGVGSTFYFTLPAYKAARDDALIYKNKQSGGIRGWFKKNPNR